MKITVVFDTPYDGWGPHEHMARMEEEVAGWNDSEPEQEYQVAHALLKKGHDVQLLPVGEDPSELLSGLRDRPPDVVFNCTEAFQNMDKLDFVVPALLEAEELCYTGAPPVALMATRNKALSKKLLSHHGIHVPDFVTYRLGEKVPAKVDMTFPVIVKPLQLDASMGISQASVVHSRDELAARVEFVHQRFAGAAIAEQFVAGRELYIGLLGNGKKLKVLPATEMVFDKDTKPEERIATKSAKWDEGYRERKGVKNVIARPLSKSVQEELERIAVTAFRTLWLRDYARLDIRLDADDGIWVIEANANPYLNWEHEISKAAQKSGLEWPDFIDKIAKVARKRYRKRRSASNRKKVA